MAFHVGQKVCCVNDESRPGKRWYGGEKPVLGCIYTVTRLYTLMGEPALWLAEIARGPVAIAEHGPDVGYSVWRFRPVKTTSIEVFQQMLSPNPERVEA